MVKTWSELELELTEEIYKLYKEQNRTVDDLPYTKEIDNMVNHLNNYLIGLGDVPALNHRRLWKLLIHARKNKKNPLPKKTTRKTGRDDDPFKGKVKGFGFSK